MKSHSSVFQIPRNQAKNKSMKLFRMSSKLSITLHKGWLREHKRCSGSMKNEEIRMAVLLQIGVHKKGIFIKKIGD